MKIIGFAQLYNELEKGNLENWFTSMRFCDYIYVYDQNSQDGSLEYYNKYPNVTVIPSDTNDFANEIKCKSLLLRTLLKDHPDTDWIFWMDGDTILESGANKTSIESILYKAQDSGFDGLKVGHYNLWRSDIYHRTDNEYDWLHKHGVTAFWKNNGNLSFPESAGLHQNQFPNGMQNIGRIQNLNLIHRGFSTDDQITTRYNIYKERGQTGWALDRLLDEETLTVEKLSEDLLPKWFDLRYTQNPLTLERLKK